MKNKEFSLENTVAGHFFQHFRFLYVFLAELLKKMEIQQLNNPPKIEAKKATKKLYSQFEKLLSEIRMRKISDAVTTEINSEIEQLNSFSNIDEKFNKQLQKSYQKVFQLQKKELNLVDKRHYTYIGIALGIALGIIFGTPLGGNLATGMPVGIAVGMALSLLKDKKAKEEGRQIDLSVE